MSSSSSERYAQVAINSLLHMIILLTFLTVLYFLIIKPTTQKILNEKFSELIEQNGQSVLQNIDQSDTNNIIDWNVVEIVAQKYKDINQGEDPVIEQHNKRIYENTFLTIVLLVFILIIIILFFKFIKGYDLNLGEILMENIIAFMMIGALEYYFFVHTASKYVPTMPSQVMVNVMDRLKYQTDKILS